MAVPRGKSRPLIPPTQCVSSRCDSGIPTPSWLTENIAIRLKICCRPPFPRHGLISQVRVLKIDSWILSPLNRLDSCTPRSEAMRPPRRHTRSGRQRTWTGRHSTTFTPDVRSRAPPARLTNETSTGETAGCGGRLAPKRRPKRGGPRAREVRGIMSMIARGEFAPLLFPSLSLQTGTGH